MTHKVLLIDDDEDDAFLVRSVAEDLGDLEVEVDWQPSFDTGLERLAGGDFDVCLVDYRMGARNGLDLIRVAMERGNRVPLILMTGQDDPALAEEARRAGAGFLVKDSDLSHLDRELRKAVSGI